MALGQTNPDGSINYGASAVNNPVNIGMNTPGGVTIDSSRHKFYVADTNNNRVLVYDLNTDNSMPDYEADFVVGQPNFSETQINRGSASPASNSFRQPSRIAVESNTGNLYVADTGNNRVLIFASVSTNDPNALHVIGAADFTSTNNTGTVSSTKMLSPSGISFSGSGSTLKIYIADKDFNRVLIFSQITANGQSADNVLGQSGFITSSSATTQTGLATPSGVAMSSSGDLYVVDTNNNRIMIWTNPITTNGQAANRVIGQTWFYSNGSGTSSSSLNGPNNISINPSGAVFISDTNNNRVLIWTNTISSNGQAADYVLGQSSFTSNAAGVSSTKMNLPLGVASTNNRLFIADSQNHRVMAYTSSITSNGQAANFVLGQITSSGAVDFYGNTLNNPQNTGFNRPNAGTLDDVNHKFYVVDSNNNRVLVYDLNIANGFDDYIADFVVGQPTFSSTAPNQGSAVSASTLNSPSDVFFDRINQRLYIADTGNNRVLIYTSTINMNNQGADLVLGQNNFTSSTPFVGQSSMASPSGVSVNTGNNAVAVADRDNNRVLVWNGLPTNNGQAADYVLGQSSFTGSSFGTSQSLLHTPKSVAYDSNSGYLYAADSDNNRVLIWTAVISANNQGADYVLGQANFTTSAAGSPVSGSTMNQPTKVAINQRSSVLYVIDSSNNRGLVFTDSILADGQAANKVIGQSNFSNSNANTSQTGLSKPLGITVNPATGYVYVIDSGNHRVLGYGDTAPNTPTGTSPSDGATAVSSVPTFQISGVDNDGDALQYRIEIARDSGFTTDLKSFDQSVSSNGWSGQTIGNTYRHGAVASFTLPTTSILSASTAYYWRVYSYDPYGSKTWAGPSAVKSFTTAAPASIAITSPQQSVTAGTVSDPINIELRDSNGNPVQVSSTLRLYLSIDSGSGEFSAQGSPFTPITYIDMPANTLSTTVYFRDNTVGNYTLTVSDADPADGATGLIDGTQPIAVVANGVVSFEFNTVNNDQVAGTPFAVTITAKDQYGNTVSNFASDVNLSSTPPGVTPTSVTFSNGFWSGDVTVIKSGNTYITASRSGASSNSNNFTVLPGAIASVGVDPANLTAKAGSDNSLTATAYDAYDNPINTGVTYNWSVDPSVGSVSPSDTASTTYTAASQIVTGTVDVMATKESTFSTSVSVTTIPDHYTFSAISSPATAGANIPATVYASDANGTTITNYTGNVAVADTTGTLTPTDVAITNGSWTGNFIITKTGSNISLAATSHGGAVTGQSNVFEVTPDVLDHVTPSTSSISLSVNTSTSVSAQAFDQYNNQINTLPYNWTTSIGSVDPTGQAVNYNSGTESGSGTISVSVTEGASTVNANISVIVSSLGVDHFAFSVIPAQVAGTPFQITIFARDQYDNNVTSYSGNGSLTYSAGTINPSTTTDFNNGAWSGSVTVTKAASNSYLSFSDGTNSGNSNPFNVAPADLDHVDILPNSANVQINQSQQFNSKAYDRYNNEITTGLTITWSINDSSLGYYYPTNSANTTFVATTKSGSTYIKCSDQLIATTTKSNSVLVQVLPGNFRSLCFDDIPTPQPTQSLIAVKITAKDSYNNTVTSFTNQAVLSDLSGSIAPDANH